MHESFGDTVVMVTGAGSGSGRGIAQRLESVGARVVVNDVDGDVNALMPGSIDTAGLSAADRTYGGATGPLPRMEDL